MEPSEAFVRIVGRHIALIAILVAVGLLGAGWLRAGDATQYSATARFAMDMSDPSTQVEAGVIADTARALATSPSLVQRSLTAIGVPRDAIKVAQNVTVTTLGSSGVVALTVKDVDPAVARQLAKRLATDVIAAHDQITDGRYASTLASLDTQIHQAQRNIAALDDQIRASGPLYDSTAPGTLPVTDRPWTTPSELLRQRTDLVQNLGSLTSERASVEANRSLRSAGAVVDSAAPAQRVAGRLVPDLAIGGLLGLVLGIAFAALLETFRPTLVGRDAIARNLGAPVLAEVQGATPSPEDVAEAAMHVELAAFSAGIQHVALLPMHRQEDVHPMADLLTQSLNGLRVDVVSRGGSVVGAHAAEMGGRPDMVAPAVANGSTGVVVVTPKVVRVAELSRIVEFFTISGWPLLGLIVVTGHRSRIRRRLEHWAEQPEDADVPLDTADH